MREAGPRLKRAPSRGDYPVVMENVALLVRFWELRARYEALGLALTKQERLELLALLQLVAAEDEPQPLEALDMSRRGLPVQMTAGSGFLAGDLKDLSHERLIVGAVGPLPTGQRTILNIADAVTGVEYTVPCLVAWSREDEPCLIGLLPDGLPLRSQFTVPVAALWRSPLGIGPIGHAVES